MKPNECSRRECGRNLNRGRWRIYNTAFWVTGFRDYCPKCGRKITEANPELRHERIGLQDSQDQNSEGD